MHKTEPKSYLKEYQTMYGIFLHEPWRKKEFAFPEFLLPMKLNSNAQKTNFAITKSVLL